MKVLITLLLLASCADGTSHKAESESEFAMTCEYVADRYLYRCENLEAICYQKLADRGGVSCKFKELK